MAVWNDNAKELLSGYLDGELTSQELAYVEELLLEHDEARRELQGLRAMRQAFQSEPAHCLSQDFSARVLQAAQMRAASMGSEQPVWLGGQKDPVRVVQPITEAASTPSSQSRRSRNWVWGMLATAAAVGLILFSLSRNQSQPNGLGLVTIVEKEKEAPIPPVNQDPLDQPESVNPGLTTETLAQNDAPTVPPSMASDEPAPVSPMPDTNALAQNLPEMKIEGLSPEDAAQLKQFESLLSAKSFMFILDFSVAREVWDSNFLANLMGRLDIAYDSPVAIDDSLLEQLKQSRFIGPTKGLKDFDENVALVFIKGRASRLDRVATEIALNVRDFPDFAFDMSADLAIQHGLSNIREFRELPDNRETARSLASQDVVSENGLSMFASPDRKRTLISHTRRLAWDAPSTFDDTMNPVSYTLLIMRPLPAK